MQYTPISLFMRKLFFAITLCFICTKIALHLNAQSLILTQWDFPDIPYFPHAFVASFMLGYVGMLYYFTRKIFDRQTSFAEFFRNLEIQKTVVVAVCFYVLLANIFILPETVIHFVHRNAWSLWPMVGAGILYLLYQVYQELMTPYSFDRAITTYQLNR